MYHSLTILLICLSLAGCAQDRANDEASVLARILKEPSRQEIAEVLEERRSQDLSPKNVQVHDTISLSNGNQMYILSHDVEGRKHYGAVIVPSNSRGKRFPVVIFTTGGDGIHKEFFLAEDFNHKAAQFPSFLGEKLDQEFVVLVPCFRGQVLIVGEDKYLSQGRTSDAFDGAATDALAFLNVAIKTVPQTDGQRIAIYGGSRGGAVALLASARDKRINRAIVVATPTNMKRLNDLYPEQFRILFLNHVLSGKVTEADARKKFIASTVIFFSGELPPVQLHQDINDPIVPAFFARQLIDQMRSEGKTITHYFYDESIHGFWEDEKYWQRVTEFLSEMK